MTQAAAKNVVLIVDDIPTNLDVLLEFLQETGFEVLVATDGEDAIQKASYAQPDIILLDVMMPGIDGFETCRRLKATDATKDIPVVFMTALSDTVDKVKGFSIGAVDYITKPLQWEEVLARINTHLTIHRQRVEIERLREQDRRYYETLSQMKDDFVNATTHDLKNPLTVIFMSVDFLRKHGRVDDRDGREYLDHIELGAQQMHGLINDLLDLAKIETGTGLIKDEVNLVTFVRSIVR
ncbi:MAG: response regulator, partial [Chloroflexi bacterium]|nr:response regulator [Chloroflexota bacterium]